MSARDWSELERRLDDAIDALNGSESPALQGDDEAQLLDTLRTVRRLRDPAEPDAGFEDRLVERTLAGAATPSLVSFPNGSGASHPPPAGAVSRPTSRRFG